MSRVRFGYALLLGGLVALLLWACGDDGPGGPDDDDVAGEAFLDAAGGVVQTADVNAIVRVPGEALGERVRISIRRLQRRDIPEILSQRGPVSAVFSFEPHGLAFRRPVRIEIYFDTDSLPAGVQLEDLTLGKVNARGELEQLTDIQILTPPAQGRAVLQGERRGIGGAASSFSPFAVWVADPRQ